MAKLILIAAAAAVMALGGQLLHVPQAQAVTCYGDYCSGQDPFASGCAADAHLEDGASVYGSYGESYVQLWWSATCKTNWATANHYAPSIKAVQDTGYEQGYGGFDGAQSWSKMIYSPVHHVKAVISGAWGVTQTTYI
ncbi:DUF2690 domain-containing protein [Nocardia tenerifensis]|uniref:DUF2690 domain-containing protein n=1 Tax=Nocardia tenerifensis TaxID=228006 RepID=UPI0012F6585F|nr:DUF2690 domain-containing protein [Nocardia tenerifensis]